MGCAACSALLASAGTDPSEIERILEEVRNQPQRQSPSEKTAPRRRSGRIGLMAGLGLAAAAATLVRHKFKGRRSRVSLRSVDPDEAMEPIPVRATAD
jgi:fatty acid-binding protein DegV